MLPAAILSILVKTDGARNSTAQLQAVDAASKRAGGNLQKLEGSTKRTSRSLSGLGSAAKAAGALVGGFGLVKGIQTINSEFREAQKTSAQTRNVLKSTGNAARITQREIEDLAGAISKKSGIDDEAIQSGENLLLTFTKIRNESGKGNDIFNRTTQIVTDMSVALGQDMKSSAIQVGKALQDPIKGITALRRVGVNFNEQQSDQIKKMVQSGDLLKAQRTILRELTTEFGGSAAAQATAGDKLRVALGNLAEASGRVLVPALDQVARVLTNVINQFVEGRGIARYIVPAFVAMGTAIGGTVQVIGEWVAAFREGNKWALTLGTTLAGLLAGFLAFKAITGVIAIFNALRVAVIGVNIAMLANPVGLVVAALAALGVALFVAYQKSEAFRNVVNTAFAALKGAVPTILAVASAIGGALTTAFGAVTGAFGAAVGAVRTAVNATITEIGRWKVAFAVVGVIVDVVRTAFAPLAAIVRAYLGAVLDVVGAIMNQVINVFRTAWNVVKALFSGTFTVLKSIVLGFGQILHGAIEVIGGILKGDFHQIWEGVKDIFRGAITATTGILRGAVSAYVGAAKAIGQGIVNGIKAALGDIGHVILDRLKEAADWLKDKVGGLFGWIGGAVSKVTGDGIGKEARKTPKMGKAGNLMGANRALAPVAGIASGFGLSVSSGLRPGAVTSSGNTSYHASGEALDVAGSPGGMLRFFRTMRSRYGPRLAELIHTPGGAGILNGQSHTYTGQVAAEHYDHVHVALDLGKPGPGVGDGPGRARTQAGKFMGDGLGSNVKAAYKFLIGKGFTAAQAAGIVGAMRGESGVNLSPTARNPSSGAYGIAQWLGGRLTALRRRPNPDSLQTQLNYLWSELQGPENAAFQRVKGANSINEAVNAWVLGFERPGAHEQTLGIRQSFAQTVFNSLKGTGAGRGGGGSGGTRARGGGGTTTTSARTVQRVSKFDRMQADAALRAARAQRSLGVTDLSVEAFTNDAGGYNKAGAKKAAAALLPQQKALGFRINQLQTALRQRGHSAAARTRWKNELAEKLPQYQQIQQQRKDLLAGPGPGEQAAPITQEDIINQHRAQASLTPGTQDDQAAAAEMLDYRQGIYLKALQGGDPRQIAQAADDLKNAMDANTDAHRDEVEAMKAHADALKAVADELKRQSDFAASVTATEKFQLQKMFADLVGSGLGALVTQRSFGPGYGNVASY